MILVVRQYNAEPSDGHVAAMATTREEAVGKIEAAMSPSHQRARYGYSFMEWTYEAPDQFEEGLKLFFELKDYYFMGENEVVNLSHRWTLAKTKEAAKQFLGCQLVFELWLV